METAAQQQQRRRSREEDEEEEEKQVDAEEEWELSAWDCGSPLYDSFEVASVCHVLDRHLMSLPVPGVGDGGSGDSAEELVPSADVDRMLLMKDRGRKLRKITEGRGKYGSGGDQQGGNGRVVRAALRGFCSAFTTLWRRQY